jgi:hypothetical protein
LGVLACAAETFGTGGVAIVMCPVAVAGGGLAGDLAGDLIVGPRK